MTNVYTDPLYSKIKEDMHKRLVEIRKKYGDSKELNDENLDNFLKAKGLER